MFDTSRSMAAAASPTAPTRLDRAVSAAVRLRAAIPDVPAGVATLTDRVLPDLLPVAGTASFDLVARRAVAVESPPPAGTGLRATSFAALAEVASGNFFTPKTTKRLVVLLTDGESDPVETSELARALHAYSFVAVRFWSEDESVFRGDGKPETAYRPDPSGRVVLDELLRALGGPAFEEGRVGSAAAALRHAAGEGPATTTASGATSHTALAPYLAGLAIVLLLVSVLPRRAPRRLQSAFP